MRGHQKWEAGGMVAGGGGGVLGRPVATESKGQEPDLVHSLSWDQGSFHSGSYRLHFLFSVFSSDKDEA